MITDTCPICVTATSMWLASLHLTGEYFPHEVARGMRIFACMPFVLTPSRPP